MPSDTSAWIQTPQLRSTKDSNRKENLPSIQQKLWQKRIPLFDSAEVKTEKKISFYFSRNRNKKKSPFSPAGIKTRQTIFIHSNRHPDRKEIPLALADIKTAPHTICPYAGLSLFSKKPMKSTPGHYPPQAGFIHCAGAASLLPDAYHKCFLSVP